MPILPIVLAVLALITIIPSCTGISSFNALQRRDEQVSAAWRQTLSVYQKRADLVPNLVDTVERYAKHESDVFKGVAEARAAAKTTSITLPENATPEDLERFAAAQRAMSGALSRLIAVAESNPDIKANTNFVTLQKQLEQIETQAGAARNRYIREVAAYNVNVRSFPSNVVAHVFGYGSKAQLQFEDEKAIQRSPRATFGKT